MVDRSHKQQETLQDKTRFAIYAFLERQERPVSTGIVLAEVEEARDYAKTFRHIAILVDAGLVEKVPGTNTYRAVEL